MADKFSKKRKILGKFYKDEDNNWKYSTLSIDSDDETDYSTADEMIKNPDSLEIVNQSSLIKTDHNNYVGHAIQCDGGKEEEGKNNQNESSSLSYDNDGKEEEGRNNQNEDFFYSYKNDDKEEEGKHNQNEHSSLSYENDGKQSNSDFNPETNARYQSKTLQKSEFESSAINEDDCVEGILGLIGQSVTGDTPEIWNPDQTCEIINIDNIYYLLNDDPSKSEYLDSPVNNQKENSENNLGSNNCSAPFSTGSDSNNFNVQSTTTDLGDTFITVDNKSLGNKPIRVSFDSKKLDPLSVVPGPSSGPGNIPKKRSLAAEKEEENRKRRKNESKNNEDIYEDLKNIIDNLRFKIQDKYSKWKEREAKVMQRKPGLGSFFEKIRITVEEEMITIYAEINKADKLIDNSRSKSQENTPKKRRKNVSKEEKDYINKVNCKDFRERTKFREEKWKEMNSFLKDKIKYLENQNKTLEERLHIFDNHDLWCPDKP